MSKDLVARSLAESLRGLCEKMDRMHELTGWEMFEYFTETDELTWLLCELLDVPPWERDKEIVYDYLDGRIDYDKMLLNIKEAQDKFNPDAYEEFCVKYEREYGSRP